MDNKVVSEKQDLTYLNWSHIRSSSGTAGTFLKSQSELNGKKTYYKLSNYDPVKGVVGHECINEIIADRLLTILGVDHLSYELINAEIEIEGRRLTTYLCASSDFKHRGESKTALENYYYTNSIRGESPYDFCIRMGFKDYVDSMIAVDYIIQNRDRHGANIEVLRNARARTLRIAPLFDHGLSLLYSCRTDDEARSFDVMEDRRCQCFIGTESGYENLKLLKGRKDMFTGRLTGKDKEVLLYGLEGVISQVFADKIWDMIYSRYKEYESI